MIRTLFLSLLAFAFTLALSVADAADWPRFRGPNGTGAVEGQLPDINPTKALWKVKLPGKGVSSPIIVKGKIYLQSASLDGKTRMLLCLSAADGTPEWTKELPGTKAATHAKNSMASGTPACDGNQIYCQWWDGNAVSLGAYDLTGKPVWQSSLGGYVSQHGPGFSPMVHNGMVFVNVDDDEHAELVAFDAKTGVKKWIAERKHVRASYSTPFILERQGKAPELILGTTTALTSYDPATGNINWEYKIVWPKGEMPLRMIGHPVYAGGLLIIYTGDGSGSRYMAGIEPGEEGSREGVGSEERHTVCAVRTCEGRQDLLDRGQGACDLHRGQNRQSGVVGTRLRELRRDRVTGNGGRQDHDDLGEGRSDGRESRQGVRGAGEGVAGRESLLQPGGRGRQGVHSRRYAPVLLREEVTR